MNIPERINKIVNSNDDLVGKCVDIVWLAKENSEVFDHLHLLTEEINESLKKYSRYCNHPDEQPLHTSINIIGEHRWSEEERINYYRDEKLKKFKVYQKLFKHYFPHESLPEYDRLRFIAKVKPEVKNDTVILYCYDNSKGGNSLSEYPLFILNNQEPFYFNIIDIDWYREESRNCINSKYITDIDPQINIIEGSSIFLDRRNEEEKKQGITKWLT